MANYDAPQRKRPPRLLNLQLSPADNVAISNQNEESSPLLKLPAEIRARTWKYATGGNTIHVSHSFRVTRTRLCEHPHDYDDVSCRLIISNSMNERKDKDDRAPDHTSCFATRNSKTGAKISLGLLLTCCNIYHEACLLPFSQNRFVFDSRDATHGVDILTKFFKRCVNNTQVSAIREVILDGHQIEGSRRCEVNAYALMQGLQKTGWIAYLHSQSIPTMWLESPAAEDLIADQNMRTYFMARLARAITDGGYSINAHEIFNEWETKKARQLTLTQQAASPTQ